MRKIHLIANWKANPKELADAKRLALAAKDATAKARFTEVALAVPHPFLVPVGEVLGKSERCRPASQDVSPIDEGAHTGSVTAGMLKSVGVQEVIIGHSERRAQGLTDEGVRARMEKVLKRGLTAVLCVGEQERDAHGEYLKKIESQLLTALRAAPKVAAGRLIVAYEPVWAIGEEAQRADTPAGFREVAIYIRKVLSGPFGPRAALTVPVLYGGSVTPENAGAFLLEGHASGLLVGRSSLLAAPFKSIIAEAERVGALQARKS